jgi:hypothetical protein
MINDDTPIAMLTVGQLRAVFADLVTPSADPDAPRTGEEIRTLYPTASDGWLRAHVAACGRGARQRRLYWPSDVRRALEAHPAAPRVRAKNSSPDPFARALQTGTIVPRKST